MSIKDEQSMDIKVSRAVRKAFEQLIQNIENEPGLILEGESQSADGENTLREIRSWLFGKRSKNDYPDDSSNN